MRAYGYEVDAPESVERDIKEVQTMEGCKINWHLFDKGDFYYTGNGNRYIIADIDHEKKTVKVADE